MDRRRLEKMMKEELDAEAIKYGLDPSDTREQCIEAIVLHLEEHGISLIVEILIRTCPEMLLRHITRPMKKKLTFLIP